MRRKLVSSPEQAASNIRRFNDEVGKSAELQSKLGQVHVWYALRLPSGNWAFGSSKFVGYEDNTAKKYLETYQDNADGRETEAALESMSETVEEHSRLGRELFSALAELLHRWGRKPRRDARIRILSNESNFGIVPRRNREEFLLSRISSDPNVCGGRPCIKGTRMRVVDIVEALANGATQKELLRDFDYLTAADIAAALLFSARASDHRIVQTA
jgi:uncharacterized protein (DUF433 family)